MKVSIIGTGYVGLVTGACLARVGHHVVCVDQVAARVDMIGRSVSPFFEPGLVDLIAEGVSAGRLSATTDTCAAVLGSEITLIAVGTPDHEGTIDLSQIDAAARAIGAALADKAGYHVVAVKSTVVPGTTEGPVRRALEESSSKVAGVDFGLSMNPEFLREGTAVADFMAPDRVVIGALDARSGEALAGLYAMFDCPKVVVSLTNAEFIKYASNAFLATAISFANELAGLCEATPGADAEVVLDGVHLDRRLSPMVGGARIQPGLLSYLRPSSGYGGSCFPKDIQALRAFARQGGRSAALMDAVAAVNAARNAAVMAMAEERIGPWAGRQVGVLGLAFKADTDDLRHSPALAIVDSLLASEARVCVHDPVATDAARQVLGDQVRYADTPWGVMDEADVLVIGTAWPMWRNLDWSEVQKRLGGGIVFDPRNALRGVTLPAGLRYLGIGVGPGAALALADRTVR